MDASGVHLNPYGRFTIQNLTSRAVDWGLGVEAPLDPNLKHSQTLCSHLAGGRLTPGATAQERALVAGKQGVPFRAVVTFREPAPLPARLLFSASQAMPVLKRLWNPAPVRFRSVHSEWWVAPWDYQFGSGVPYRPDR
jgi:hypothetical protein